MATADNERYLRYLFLLGRGGPLVLKGIINREVKKEGKPLSQILLENNGRLRQLIRSDSQYERVFPSAGPVNNDLDTWDISLLCLALLTIFGSKLSSQERNDIKSIRTFRNDIQGHFASISLEEIEYNNYRSDLIVVLLNLSNALNRQIHDSCQDLIKTAASGSLEIRSTLEDFKEFQEELSTQIKSDFGATHIKLDAIINEIKQMQERGLPQATHQQLSNIETKQEEIKQLTNKIKDLLIQLIKKDISCSDIKEDVETRMTVRSDTVEHSSDAEDILVQRINEILTEIKSLVRTSDVQMVDEGELRRRIQQLLLRNQTCSDQQELTFSVLELILDVIRQPGTSVLPAKKSCIQLQYRCTTYKGLLGLLQYLESENYQKRLTEISLALAAQFGFACSLTTRISTEYLRETLHNLERRRNENDRNFLQCESNVVVPVRCTNMQSLEHVWIQFQEGEADHHMKRISNALSKIVGGKTTVSTSVDLEQFKTALHHTGGIKKDEYGIKADDIIYGTALDNISTKLEIAVIGCTGAGKSSLIYTLRGIKAYDYDAAHVEEIDRSGRYSHPNNKNVFLTDHPSIGSVRYQKDSYPKIVNLNSFDIFLICSKSRLSQNDIWIAKEIHNLGKLYYILRTHVDLDYQYLCRLSGYKEDVPTSFKTIMKEFERQMDILPGKPPIFLISSREPTMYDFPRMIKQIQNDAYVVNAASKARDVFISKSHIIKIYHHNMEDIPLFLTFQDSYIYSKADVYKNEFHLSDHDIAQYASACGISESSFRTNAKLKTQRESSLGPEPFTAYVTSVVKAEKKLWKYSPYFPIIGVFVSAKLGRTILQKILDDCRDDAMRVYDFLTSLSSCK